MTDGPLLFTRYAYPPNELGYCGPTKSEPLLEALETGKANEELRPLAARFEGAWPYLRLLADALGVADPLHPDVVHAYWVGNAALERVSLLEFGNSTEDRFRDRGSRQWTGLSSSLVAGAVPHHSFHVFCVYPWVGLLRTGAVEPARHVLDRCRIRIGRVVAAVDHSLVVESTPIVFENGVIREGEPAIESVRYQPIGDRAITPGALMTLHWDWACDVIEPSEARQLQSYNRRHMAMANRALRASPLAAHS
jgi:hypothetical protein